MEHLERRSPRGIFAGVAISRTPRTRRLYLEQWQDFLHVSQEALEIASGKNQSTISRIWNKPFLKVRKDTLEAIFKGLKRYDERGILRELNDLYRDPKAYFEGLEEPEPGPPQKLPDLVDALKRDDLDFDGQPLTEEEKQVIIATLKAIRAGGKRG